MSTEKRLAFICYRNADSGESAEILYGQLSKKLGSDRLFLAPESIDSGKKWPPEIEDALAAAVVMVVLIGRDWLRVQHECGERRLDLPDDWVVREICVAIERGIPIIPVLVDGADRLSKEALPSDIKKLVDYQSVQIRRGVSQKLEKEDVEILRRALEARLSPIKGLYSYEASDRAIFKHLQRERELGECLKALTNPEERVGVLYGRTGCGKTSFLQAGVMPALDGPKTNSPTGIYVRFTREDPFRTLRNALQVQLQLSTNGLGGCDLPSWFNQVAATRHSPIVLLFDQFEEFLHSERDVRAKFVDGLKYWYEHQSALPLKILFTVHSPDHLGPLFTQIRCYNLCQFGLGPFTSDQAFASLEALAEADGMAFDESFVRATVLGDILGSEADGILPLELQIVAWAIHRREGANLGFTEAGYNEIGGIKGSLDHLLFKELRLLPEQEQETLLWILDSLIDRDAKPNRRRPLTVNEVSNKLPMKISKDDIEGKLKWLTKERLVWSKDAKDEKDENVVRCYELAHRHLIEPVIKTVDEKFSDVRTANDLLDSHVRYYRTKHRFRRLKVKDYWLIRKVMQQNKIQWGLLDEQDKKTIIKKSQRFVRGVVVACVGIIMTIVVLGYSFMPSSGETKVKEFLEKALNDEGKLLPMETLPKVIAALGEWNKWEEKAKNFPKAKADRSRSELSLLAANKDEWSKAETFANEIKNAELKAITFTHLAKQLKEPGDSETRNRFVKTAFDAAKNMPEGERAERVHVLYNLQHRATDSALDKDVKDFLNKEKTYALDEIDSRIAEQATPKEPLQESVHLREQVRLLALAAEVASYAGDAPMIRKNLEDAKDILTKIKDDHARSIAFHLLIEGTARCVGADGNDDAFYNNYLIKLVKSTSPREHILGLIEASAIILRATPPDAATKLAIDFLHQAEDFASSLRRDHEKQQLSEQKVPSPASFLLREVRTLQLAHAQLVSKYMVVDTDGLKESSIALVPIIQESIKKEMPRKENVGPERLDLLLTQLAIAKAFAKVDEPRNVEAALIFARDEAKKLPNPHQKSAVLRAIVEIAAGFDTVTHPDRASAAPDRHLMGFAREVLKDEILEASDKGWANASYVIGLARQANNESRDAIGAIDLLWEFFGKCPNPDKFSSIVTEAKQSGPAANFALQWVVREMASAHYWSCAHEELQNISDYTLQVSGYAAILLGDRADIGVFQKIGLLAESGYVRPQSQDLDQGVSMRLVPGGYFIMGTADRDIDQSPPHYVYLNTFHIDEHEVTVDQYAQFQKLNPNEPLPQEWGDEIIRNHGRKPVVGINYGQAIRYCEWADKRLPTEAEWEKAARGIDGRIYPWGNDPPTPRHANFGKSEWNNYAVLEAVGSFEDGKSPYGGYHMAGNVWEWVEDWYGASSYIHNAPENPQGPPAGNWRVLRGGAWDNGENDKRKLEASYRLYKDPPYRYYTIGFRCAK